MLLNFVYNYIYSAIFHLFFLSRHRFFRFFTFFYDTTIIFDCGTIFGAGRQICYRLNNWRIIVVINWRIGRGSLKKVGVTSWSLYFAILAVRWLLCAKGCLSCMRCHVMNTPFHTTLVDGLHELWNRSKKKTFTIISSKLI